MEYDLYVIIDDDYLPGANLIDITRASIRGGACVIQLRCKHGSTSRLFELAVALREITAAAGIPLIINDRLDVALAVGADGVHLGQDDLPAAAARRILGNDGIIGVSAATPGEARRAVANGADYLGVGAIYSTGTKRDAGDPIGPAAITRLRSVCDLPLVGIGGISHGSAAAVIAAGANGVAVVSAVIGKPDPEAAAAGLREEVREAKAMRLLGAQR